MTDQRPDIRSLNQEDLLAHFLATGQPKYRTRQVWEWIWQKGAGDFADMSNLPAALRGQLSEAFTLHKMRIADEQVSADGTVKCAFQADPGRVVEGVLIPTDSRMTACISSQVGCSLSCKFCATGRLKMMRNLTAGEIVDQVEYLRALAERKYNIPLSNIVYMGMGEPLLNYKQVLQSTARITSPEGLGMSPQRITVSTAGIAKMIVKLGDDQVKFNLALSLHAANDEKRSRIMEINESNNLDSLAQALRYFYEKTGTRITFEYIIFDAFNDTIKDAQELAVFAKNVPVKINIIEYNPIDNGEYRQANPERVNAFAAFLESRNLIVNIRRSRGKDIDAACGQLANKNKAAMYGMEMK